MDNLSHRVGVLLCRQHSLGSYGLVLDTFRMANQVGAAHHFALTRISQDGEPVAHSDGVMAVDAGLEALSQQDVVLIPSLWVQGPQAVQEQAELIHALAQLNRDIVVATLCTGAYLLAAAGRLDDHQSTTHWMLASGLQHRYPQLAVDARQNLTHDREVVCSGGSLAGVDACMYVIQLLAGRSFAKQVARLMVTDISRGPQTLYAPAVGWRRHHDEGIQQVEAYLQTHAQRSIALTELAASIHTSVRTLQRRFLAATGMTPVQYQQAIRIEQAKDLLETRRIPVADVAAQVGYEDRVAFGRVFKKVTGLTPAAYRQSLIRGGR